jgi:uncharacterized protein
MEEMSTEQIERFLADARIGRLCMAGSDGRPYTIPLPFCWLDGALYVRLPLTGRKGQILGQNERVCFEADEFTETLDDYASVLVEGRLVEVDGVEEKRRVKTANDLKYDRLRKGQRPGHGRATPIDEIPLRKLVVERLGGRRKEGGRLARPNATSAVEGVISQC